MQIIKTPEEMDLWIKRNKELCEKYPFLTWRGNPLYSGYSKDAEPYYEYTWEDDLEDGWVKAFCPQIWDDLKAILEKADYVNKFEFAQIKEKWGVLTMYYNGVPNKIYNEVRDWEEKYMELSKNICKHCGKPATRMTTGWITYICDDCANQIGVTSIPLTDAEEYYKDPEAYWEKHSK